MGIISDVYNKEAVKLILLILEDLNINEKDLEPTGEYDLDQHWHSYTFFSPKGTLEIKWYKNNKADVSFGKKCFQYDSSLINAKSYD